VASSRFFIGLSQQGFCPVGQTRPGDLKKEVIQHEPDLSAALTLRHAITAKSWSRAATLRHDQIGYTAQKQPSVEVRELRCTSGGDFRHCGQRLGVNVEPDVEYHICK
jgi:hypothetical protein